MFKLNVGSTKYNVYFRYRPVPDKKYDKDHTVPLRSTQCYIEAVDVSKIDTNNPDEKPGYFVVAHGETVQSRQDNFCRATGRKIALARALANLTHDRELRKAFWDAYFWSQLNNGAQAMFTAAQQVFDSLGQAVQAVQAVQAQKAQAE